MAAHNILGRMGEEKAANYLLAQGYTIRHRNWRSGKNELDIVAFKDGELIIVEVKTRRNRLFEEPQDAVDGKKIRRIVSATDCYLRLFSLSVPVRFDVITIVGDEKDFCLEHIQEAFNLPLW